ncbi:MAG: NAD(P)-dependent oxidoreductase [Variovorax sp.]|nr:MAG: NAD(P)-dependent oxidoreductase [Variovorax sp.]
MVVGFIGLGRMGQGMALNLVRSGAQVVVYDISSEAIERLTREGAQAGDSVADVARRVDVLFTSLPGPAQFEEVVMGLEGVMAHMRAGLVLFDLSTNSLPMVRRTHAAFRERGASVLDAPVSGGPAGAASGDLAILVGGDKAVFDRHLDLLRAIGDKPTHVGIIGCGTVAKLAHNTLGYMFLESMAETFSLAVKAGMDPLDLWKAMRLGMVGRGSPMDMLVNQFLPGKYEPPAFALKLAHKDVMLTTAMAKELGVPMRLANMTLEEMTEALGRGFGEQDSRAYLKLQLERAGVTIEVDPARLREAVTAAKG